MDGNCYQWAFDFMLNFMWRHNEADPDQYRMCVGIVRDPESGKFYDHAWIEDTATNGIFYKLKSKRKIDRMPNKEYFELMNPRYVKSYSGREMVKKALKAGIPGLLANVPSKVLAASDFKGHWDDARHSAKKTAKGRSGKAKTKGSK